MTRSIYVAAPEGQTGKSVVAVGIIDALAREVSSVGVFRPIVKGGPERDEILEAVMSIPAIEQSYESAVGVTYADVKNNPDEALSKLVAKYGAFSDDFEAIVILGSDYTDVMSATELTFNARVAANLNAPVCLTVSGRARTPAEVRQLADSALAEFTKEHARVIAVIATRLQDDDETLAYTHNLLERIPNVVVAALPAHPVLAAPMVEDQFAAASAKVISGRPEQLHSESQGVLVAGMTLPNVLDRLFTDCTVVLPGDRSELIPGLLLAHSGGGFPKLAGLILVGGYEVPSSIQRLMGSIHHELPIASTQLGTYTTAERLFHLEGIQTSSPRKIEIARRVFNERVDTEALLSAMKLAKSNIRTPMMFEFQLNEMARRDRRRIVLPESGDDRILQAAAIVLARGTADIILLGDPVDVKQRASALGISLDTATITDPKDPELLDRFSAEYAKLRAHKGVTLEQARAKMADVSYVGTMMVHLGMADGMVSGAANSTANTIRPSLEFIKTKPGVKVVSSSFLMCMADRVDVYGDCAVNPDPTAEQLADIAISSAETATAFGIEPRVAMLSYSTGDSGSGADVDKVRTATELVRERAPELLLEGPIQFDAAVDAAVAKKKLPDSAVAGKATVFIFPDLNTGNNTYKAVQRSSGALAVGPVLQGLNKPVNDLSRGALVDDIVNTIAITAIQAQNG